MLYIGYLIFNIRLSSEVGKTMQKKMKDISRYGTKEECLKPQSLPMANFLFLVRERTGQWGLYFDMLGASCQSVPWDKDNKQVKGMKKQTRKLHQNRWA